MEGKKGGCGAGTLVQLANSTRNLLGMASVLRSSINCISRAEKPSKHKVLFCIPIGGLKPEDGWTLPRVCSAWESAKGNGQPGQLTFLLPSIAPTCSSTSSEGLLPSQEELLINHDDLVPHPTPTPGIDAGARVMQPSNYSFRRPP